MPGVDSHAHVFGGPEYPFAAEAAYRPIPAEHGTAQGFLAVLDAHGLTHGLVVSAQPYGRDNRCMLDAIAAANGRLKGVALVHAGISDRDLTLLADGGVVGIRVNLNTYGMRELEEPGTERLLGRIRDLRWFLQVHCRDDQLVEAAPLLRKSGVTIVFDHFGRPDVARGLDQPGFAALLEFGRSGHAFVKLSGPFRSSRTGPPYGDVDAFVLAAIDAFTLDRCVWGSDWPFVNATERVDYGPGLACLARWLPDAADRGRVLWETPARLLGF